ncbi:hypothetical protein AALO_G00175990 [Alosa alosa]|uniref:Uncharacterized protein n=1 Tax=Alosa alosa TaxID=278164 RepID=A0AAV6G7K9_9TELE|nr:hypothetical protein AALO_G00175990 [Alosa alosa]
MNHSLFLRAESAFGGQQHAWGCYLSGRNCARERTPAVSLSWGRMDVPTLPPRATLEVDVDLGFALFFFFLLCLFLLGTMVRCAQMVLNPYSAISVSTYQEEQVEG